MRCFATWEMAALSAYNAKYLIVMNQERKTKEMSVLKLADMFRKVGTFIFRKKKEAVVKTTTREVVLSCCSETTTITITDESSNRAGRDIITSCPFCGEKTLVVDLRRKIWQCFHCKMLGRVKSTHELKEVEP
jgi:hypothetical protein